MVDWAEIFLPSTPIVEILVRGTVMFLAIYGLVRIAGQRESGGHSLTDVLVVVLIAEAAASGMSGQASGIGDSLLLVGTILGWSVALDAIAYRFPSLGPLIKGRPRPLVIDGRVDQRALRREFMRPDELMSELRLHGVSDLEEVARAYNRTQRHVVGDPGGRRRAGRVAAASGDGLSRRFASAPGRRGTLAATVRPS